MLFHESVVCIFLLLSSIPLHEYITIYVSIALLMGIWVVQIKSCYKILSCVFWWLRAFFSIVYISRTGIAGPKYSMWAYSINVCLVLEGSAIWFCGDICISAVVPGIFYCSEWDYIFKAILSKIKLKKNIKSIIVLWQGNGQMWQRPWRQCVQWLIFRDFESAKSFIQNVIQIIIQHIFYCFSSFICKMGLIKTPPLGAYWGLNELVHIKP